MSDALVVCPSCGMEVREGRYCSKCGTPLHEHQESVLYKVEEPQVNSKESGPVPDFDVIIEDMDRDSMVKLLARAELEVIAIALDAMIEQIQATRAALKLSESDKKTLALRAEELRERFDKTKSRRIELSAVEGKIPLEVFTTDLDTQEEKLLRLKEIKGTLDSEVYEEQRQSLLYSIKFLRAQVKAARKTSKRWLKSIDKQQKVSERELSRIEAKHKIGDISSSTYATSKQRLEHGLAMLTRASKLLDEAISASEKN